MLLKRFLLEAGLGTGNVSSVAFARAILILSTPATLTKKYFAGRVMVKSTVPKDTDLLAGRDSFLLMSCRTKKTIHSDRIIVIPQLSKLHQESSVAHVVVGRFSLQNSALLVEVYGIKGALVVGIAEDLWTLFWLVMDQTKTYTAKHATEKNLVPRDLDLVILLLLLPLVNQQPQ